VIPRARRPWFAGLLALGLLLAACSPQPSASGTLAVPSPGAEQPSPSASGGVTTGTVRPAPGSDSSVYQPNPAAIVVAIDPGHGGCLDWGVPDPQERGVDFSEKAMTLAIGLELRRLLEEQGVSVVMTREADAALAGDDYPQLGCNGPPWRDVNGDGEAGFDPEGAVRTRDELQARLDVANVARADVLVSIHINSMTQNGVVFEIAATQTFYTDETAWGVDVTAPLAQAIQDGVVRSMDSVASYDRQDRGIQAQNLYIVAPPLLKTTPERPDLRKQPTRGALMPSLLTEVGSITLPAEQSLLSSPSGQAAAAAGIFDALAAHFGARPLAASYLVPGVEAAAGVVPEAVPGDGPPFWPPAVDGSSLVVRLTNTGTEAWPAGTQLAGAWEATEQPYLRVPPAELAELPLAGGAVPTLQPGESVDVEVLLPEADEQSGVYWITLVGPDGPLSELGSPPLQLGTGR
jgi:N-acetylmuramoyl-L-alanine amidase